MASTDSVIAAWSASGAMAQNTVSRMIMGGSTGLRMMIALPRPAPPTCSMARAVVTVNSSMLARVPGPAEREAIEATISAYGTGVTRDTACTSGMVAWPPQVIMLRLGAARCWSRLTAGQTSGPTAAGVRSTAWMPAAAYCGALAWWGRGGGAPNPRLRPPPRAHHPVHAARRGLQPELAGPPQPVGVRIDPDHV